MRQAGLDQHRPARGPLVHEPLEPVEAGAEFADRRRNEQRLARPGAPGPVPDAAALAGAPGPAAPALEQPGARLADQVRRQRQGPGPVPARAQAEARQQPEDRPVALLHRAGCGGTLQQPRERLGEQRRRRAGAARSSPLGAPPRREAQEGTRRARGGRAAVPCPPRGLVPDELGHPLDGRPGPVGTARAGAGRDEAPHAGHGAHARRRGRPHHVARVVRVAGDPGRGVAMRRVVHHPLPAAAMAAGEGSRDHAEAATGRTRSAGHRSAPTRHNPELGVTVLMPCAASAGIPNLPRVRCLALRRR